MLLFSWRGLGFLVPVVFFVAVGIVILFFDGRVYTNLLIFLITTVLCLIIGIIIKVYRKSTCERSTIVTTTGIEKEVLVINKINKKTGITETTIVQDTFFGIHVIYWSIVSAGISVYHFVNI